MKTIRHFFFILTFACVFGEHAMAKSYNADFKTVKKHEQEQKYEAALNVLDDVLKRAMEEKQESIWTKALTQKVRLRIGLHGYETAVRMLHDTPWPETTLYRSILHLVYAKTLFSYYTAYAWEINKREKVISTTDVDLKKWTAQQIFEVMHQAYWMAWQHRSDLGSELVSDYGDYFYSGSYPKGIRDTLRDVLVYSWVEMLGNTVTWNPGQEQNTYLLDFSELVEHPDQRKQMDDKALQSPDTHPILKMVSILDTHFYWHTKADHAEAALETQLERFRRLSQLFTKAEQLKTIREVLSFFLKGYTSYRWWATGQYELALMIKQTNDLVEARRIAELGYEEYPRTLGGNQCLHLIKSIEMPNFSIEVMHVDQANKRSLRITHRNMETLYLRAYRLDFYEWMQKSKNNPTYINWDTLWELIQEKEPDTSWTVSFKNVHDYQDHQTYLTPDGLSVGFYVIAASVHPDFKKTKNRIDAATLFISNYVTMISSDNRGHEITVLDARTGNAVPNIDVYMYQWNYPSSFTRIEQLRTDPNGRCMSNLTNTYNVYVIAQKDDDLSINTQNLYDYRNQSDPNTIGVFVYTDRSIYRPLQTVHYKIVTYQGAPELGNYHCVKNEPVTIFLNDSNGKELAKQTVMTNSFGTASGEFIIPQGSIVGNYQVIASLWNKSGQANIQVEEYKRPTFEVELQKPDKQLTLNTPATITGKVKYYFGLPVTNGTVVYRITREPEFPFWYWWFYADDGIDQKTAEVAAGKLSLTPEGTFQIAFTPQADPNLPDKKNVTYSFQLSVDVTDDGGETRSEKTGFRIGYVAVTANVTLKHGFIQEDESIEIPITRTTLDGIPQKGTAGFQILKLKQPKETQLSSEIPEPVKDKRKTISGDVLRPRWAAPIPIAQRLFQWEDGELITQGELTHTESGEATVIIPGLSAGAYRLRYKTTDDFGSPYTTHQEFIVAQQNAKISVPFFMFLKNAQVPVGHDAVLYCGSGFDNQDYWIEFYQSNKLLERRHIISKNSEQVLFPVTENHRGGVSVRLYGLRDNQFEELTTSIYVPWDNKDLSLNFTTFRDRLRPGQQETWTVSIKGTDNEKVAAEVLAYMYDRSLDFFVAHQYPIIKGIYPTKTGLGRLHTNLSHITASSILSNSWYPEIPGCPSVTSPGLISVNGYGIGGLGTRRYRSAFGKGMDMSPEMDAMPMAAAPMEEQSMSLEVAETSKKDSAKNSKAEAKPEPTSQTKETDQIRSNFNETAFFLPHLLTDNQGNVSISFTVPDSVTAWRVYVHALTQDLKSMTISKDTVTVKELMVRPYLPRFLREGDKAGLQVVINNASDRLLQGKAHLAIIDPVTQEDKSAVFGIAQHEQVFQVQANRSEALTWNVIAPHEIGGYAVKVMATSNDLSDGELRPIPVLPSRFHLMQSKFATLKEGEKRILALPDMSASVHDDTLIHDQFIVTLDTQLIYTVLKALPYLVNYPYECVEQTLNRFLSTGIVTRLFDQYPPIRNMAKQFSKRQTQYEPWKADDPNRTMTLEETPWLRVAQGGKKESDELINVLDERIARTQRDDALEKLRKAQYSNGAFSWWPGGPESFYMTLYLMYGFAKANEFGVDVPKDMIQRGWKYLFAYFKDYYEKRMIVDDYGYESITFLNYVLSCYPDASFYEHTFTEKLRNKMLEYSYKNWKNHCPYLKAYLALTLFRMDRKKDAELILDSIMDSAKTELDQGTFWAPEDRGWLWYNDHIESHAFILRALMEIKPEDQHIDGLVLWLLLNKKFNQWKSTRTTAEVIYALVYTLKHQGALAVHETANVKVGGKTHVFEFSPDEYTGEHNQIIVKGKDIQPEVFAETEVSKQGKGYMFASVTWHYSTEKLPESSRGDYLEVTRKFFLRKHQGKEMVLIPIDTTTAVSVGDQVEVQLSIRAKHPMEYVHLRDPRGAGFEPERSLSGFHWDLGIGWYEEIRDNGTNFFFEWLPQGEYTFKYRIRATMSGTFSISPATLQSMYAPEFGAFSSGKRLTIQTSMQ
ncbi:MAG: hypothetical protein HQK77_18380 [Desulfobacterales bacterium]|nr:hypothetical protein [Desulfobacterales bacterium]